ncbi:hypothetical protein Tco_0339234 [Tanacetum coccineum]
MIIDPYESRGINDGVAASFPAKLRFKTSCSIDKDKIHDESSSLKENVFRKSLINHVKEMIEGDCLQAFKTLSMRVTTQDREVAWRFKDKDFKIFVIEIKSRLKIKIHDHKHANVMSKGNFQLYKAPSLKTSQEGSTIE